MPRNAKAGAVHEPPRGGAGDVFRTHTGHGATLVVHRDFEDAALALGLPGREAALALLAQPTGGRGRATTATVNLPGLRARLHLRPVRHGGLFAPLWTDRLLGLARPEAELRVTECLRSRGAPVPRAVLAAGWRAAPLWSAVVGTLQVEAAVDALAWLSGAPERDALDAAAAAAGRAVRRFHDAGGHHADLHLKNLLVRAEAGPERVLLIDLDKARAADPPDARRRMRELMRLYRSLKKRGVYAQVGASGRAAFFSGYVAGDEALARALLAHWAREERRVARHALAYRSGG